MFSILCRFLSLACRLPSAIWAPWRSSCVSLPWVGHALQPRETWAHSPPPPVPMVQGLLLSSSQTRAAPGPCAPAAGGQGLQTQGHSARCWCCCGCCTHPPARPPPRPALREARISAVRSGSPPYAAGRRPTPPYAAGRRPTRLGSQRRGSPLAKPVWKAGVLRQAVPAVVPVRAGALTRALRPGDKGGSQRRRFCAQAGAQPEDTRPRVPA